MAGETYKFLIEEIHGVPPYDGFDLSGYTPQIAGWGDKSPIFDALIGDIRPSLIIEVGTWLGASAIHMGQTVKELGLDCPILCIDTWLGAAFHWRDPESRAQLNLDHGYPRLYYQFLANVMLSDLTDVIIPMPLASTAAYRWLKNIGVTADLIYIDADHEAEAVYTDISSYWNLRSPTGVMFGDDYHPAFPGVQKAVHLVAENLNIDLQIFQEKWVLGFTKKIKFHAAA